MHRWNVIYSHNGILFGHKKKWSTDACYNMCAWIFNYFCPVPLSATLWTEPVRLLCPRDSLSKNTWVGSHALLQGIFPTQRSNSRLLCLLHWQDDSLLIEPPGKPHYKYGWTLKTYAKWKEPVTKGHILYDPLYMNCPEESKPQTERGD